MRSQILPRLTLGQFPLVRILRTLTLRRALRRDRKRLALLDDHLLKDIGISREEARREAERFGWDAPAHWTR